jgi:prefoldin subunit 5
MSQAMQLIVDGYVKLSARKALEDLKEHRERLATELRSLNSVLDLSSTVGHLEREIAIIDDGLARLKNTASVVSIAVR